MIAKLWTKTVTLIGLTFIIVNCMFSQAFANDAKPEWLYSVRPGDTLISFAKLHLNNPADWHALQSLNNIKNPKRMQLGQVVRVPLALVKQTPVPAEVIMVSGIANLQLTNNNSKPVAVGLLLSVGSLLTTGINSIMQVKFADGSVVTMQPSSSMKLDALSIYSGGGMVDTKLRLQQGKVEVRANPAHKLGNNMQIFTPSAVAAVRGTTFRVATDDVSIRQETLEGNVALSAAGHEVAVVKGYGSLSEGGNAPLPPILLLAAPQVASLPSTIENATASFVIPAQAGAVAFLGKVAMDDTFNVVLAENTSQGNDLSFNDLPDGQYYLKVRAKDKHGLEGYDATHAFVLNARPFAPNIESPIKDAVVRQIKPTLAWGKIDDAKTYLLELAADAQFTHVLDSLQVANNTYTLESALPAGQYFWRLASQNGADQGPYNMASSFTVKPMPSAPDISQLSIKIEQNRVFVNTINPIDGLTYKVALSNEKNNQQNIWVDNIQHGQFNFLLKEYGKQTLSISHAEPDGTVGPAAVYYFNALPQ